MNYTKTLSFIMKTQTDKFFKSRNFNILVVANAEAESVNTALSAVDGCLLISEQDPSFDEMMDLFEKSVFDCVALTVPPEEISYTDFKWLELEIATYLNDVLQISEDVLVYIY